MKKLRIALFLLMLCFAGCQTTPQDPNNKLPVPEYAK
jgi:hypothetical protein